MTSPATRALAIAGALLIPALMNAQVDRSKAPAPGPAPAVNVGGHETFLLPNGMRVIVVENHKLPLVGVQVRFDIEPVLQGDKAGYQDLMGELLASGTVRRTKKRIDEQVDALGASLSTSNDGLYASSLKKNFPKLMELVQEVVMFATFPDDEFQKARTRMQSAVRTRVDDPDQIADAVARALIYGKSHPYGEVVTEESLAKVERGHVIAYYQRFFRPEKGYIVFVGDITREEARVMCEQYFGPWKGAEIASTTENGVEVVQGLGPIVVGGSVPRPDPERLVCFVDRPGSAQSVIKFCSAVPLRPNAPDALPAQVMNTILGGGVFNARLMQNLREDKAYTYGAYSSLSPDRRIGSWTGGCSVRNAVTDSAVAEIIHEMKRMQGEPVTEEELALAKSYMAGSFARSLEDPGTLARFALNTYINELAADHYASYLQRLDTVGAETVQQMAMRYLRPDNCFVLVVGDKAEVANKLAGYSLMNAVVFYDVNGDIYKEKFEPAPAGLTAKDVVEAHVRAIGGRSAIAAVKDMERSYAATVQGMEVVLTEHHKAPDSYALDMRMGPMTLQKLVYAGGRGYRQDMEGRMELNDIELADARESSHPFPEAHYEELDYEMFLSGIVTIDGKRTYRVQFNKENGVFTEYYDVETGLKVRRSEPEETAQGRIEVVTDYSDYREVGGVKVPYAIRQNAGMDMRFTATDIKVNQGVDASLFRLE